MTNLGTQQRLDQRIDADRLGHVVVRASGEAPLAGFGGIRKV